MNFNRITVWSEQNTPKPANVNGEFDNVINTLNLLDQGIRSWGPMVLTSLSTSVATKSGNYTLTSSDQIVLVDVTSAAVTITLPTAVGISGRLYTIKDWKGKSATNAITVATTSSQTIDGNSTVSINYPYASNNFVSDGSNWSLV